MKRRFLILTLASVTMILTNSCQKETAAKSDELQKKATDLGNYVVNNKFIPVDFYSDSPIDYIETDAEVLAETDLKKYIYPYLSDDIITFNSDKTLMVDQGPNKMDGKPQQTFQATNWGTDYSKANNLVYLTYLDYFYEQRRYTLVSWTSTEILVYIDWTSKDGSKKAKLYTRFQKIN